MPSGQIVSPPMHGCLSSKTNFYTMGASVRIKLIINVKNEGLYYLVKQIESLKEPNFRFYRFSIDLDIVRVLKLVEGEVMIRFHNPAAETAVDPEPYELDCNIRTNNGADLTVGLLANGFPDSDVFLKKLGEALEKRLPKITTKFWNKGNAGVPASEEILKEIAESCQVAIAAYGH